MGVVKAGKPPEATAVTGSAPRVEAAKAGSRRRRRRQPGQAPNGVKAGSPEGQESACSKSAHRSSTCSMPTATRIVPSPIPFLTSSSAVSMRWEVLAG